MVALKHPYHHVLEPDNAVAVAQKTTFAESNLSTFRLFDHHTRYTQI